ncbi:M20 family metallopeptidase (plasmid) [Bartonella sp. HY329]|uniref:M20 family metallopeptidase n=1 Tax=unclassified Bartonella TaxID=2645622 RepID=UPI0021C80D48|nr:MULTISPECIES: M20 family metallopeptidase [unclassified Bartonella]UXM96601.1 M20 family metallopeptidase [Bartonella sp. HY329]UXN10924.1 M20 family metallopeptidase [Bartonella sp. HY328]
MQNSERVWDIIEEKRSDYEGLSDRVWGMPEIAYTEYRSVLEHKKMLEAEGFKLHENVAGIPTAIIGEAGEGGPIIAFLGEYDALPGLSQEANIAQYRPLEGNGNGHGCGHNLLGSAALLAAAAVKDWLIETGTAGRVRYYGCPAEEGGAAKAYMARAGAFDDVDIAITWHPASFTRVGESLSLANTRMDFKFTGRTSHAAASPHLGRSALDAVELMNVGVNYLREHVPSDSRIHYAYLDAGGVAPNVVQGKAWVRYAIRSSNLSGMLDLNERVKKIAYGAAMMTETKVDISIMSAVSNMLPNTPLQEVMDKNMHCLGGVAFDEKDRKFAAEIQATLSAQEIETDYLRVGQALDLQKPLCDYVIPYTQQGVPMIGSTDVGDVSWVVPTVEAKIATHAIGTPGHSWQITAQGKAPAAHKGMLYAAKVMAGTGLDVLRDPVLMQEIKNDHKKRLAKTPYICPIPADVKPPIQPKPTNLE